MVNTKVIRNKLSGYSEGYGFVEFASHDAAERVLGSYNGLLIPHTTHRFRLNWASFGISERKRPSVANGGGSDASSPSGSVGGRRHSTGSQGSGAGAGDGGSTDGAAPPDGAEEEHSLFVGDLGHDVGDYLLQETFRQRYPSVRSAKVVTDPNTGRSRGYGFVRFGDEEEMKAALVEMAGVKCGSRPMRTSSATPRKTSTPSAPVQPPAPGAYPPGSQIPQGVMMGMHGHVQGPGVMPGAATMLAPHVHAQMGAAGAPAYYAGAGAQGAQGEPPGDGGGGGGRAAGAPQQPGQQQGQGQGQHGRAEGENGGGGGSGARAQDAQGGGEEPQASSPPQEGAGVAGGEQQQRRHKSQPQHQQRGMLSEGLAAQLGGLSVQVPSAAGVSPTSMGMGSPLGVGGMHAHAHAAGGMHSPPGMGPVATGHVPPPPDTNNTTIFVGGLDSNVTEDMLTAAFSAVGELIYVRIPPGKNCGFVQYVLRQDAEHAMLALQGRQIGHDAFMRLSWGKSATRATATHHAAAAARARANAAARAQAQAARQLHAAHLSQQAAGLHAHAQHAAAAQAQMQAMYGAAAHAQAQVGSNFAAAAAAAHHNPQAAQAVAMHAYMHQQAMQQAHAQAAGGSPPQAVPHAQPPHAAHSHTAAYQLPSAHGSLGLAAHGFVGSPMTVGSPVLPGMASPLGATSPVGSPIHAHGAGLSAYYYQHQAHMAAAAANHQQQQAQQQAQLAHAQLAQGLHGHAEPAPPAAAELQHGGDGATTRDAEDNAVVDEAPVAGTDAPGSSAAVTATRVPTAAASATAVAS